MAFRLPFGRDPTLQCPFHWPKADKFSNKCVVLHKLDLPIDPMAWKFYLGPFNSHCFACLWCDPRPFCWLWFPIWYLFVFFCLERGCICLVLQWRILDDLILLYWFRGLSAWLPWWLSNGQRGGLWFPPGRTPLPRWWAKGGLYRFGRQSIWRGQRVCRSCRLCHRRVYQNLSARALFLSLPFLHFLNYTHATVEQFLSLTC